jgi:hypothetical protein
MSITIVDNDTLPVVQHVSFRSKRSGPENDLIERFLESPLANVPRGCNAIVFREPRIESGFPDLVIVICHRATAVKWNPLRAALNKTDIRVMHLLAQRGAISLCELCSIYSKKVIASLERLESAEMVKQAKGNWLARPLSANFAARHIIAVEAKMSKWKEAIEQAHLNTWFASASFIMVPQILKREEMLSSAKSHGLGVLSSSDDIDVREISQSRLPMSYASWLFNEWSWRIMMTGEDHSNANLCRFGSTRS